MAMEQNIFNLTAPVVMGHPNLFTPRGFGKKGKETGDPKYSANFILPAESADLKDMKTLAIKVARSKWPNRDLKELKFPFVGGDKIADKRKQKIETAGGKYTGDADFQRGHVVFTARSKYQPRLSVIENGRIIDLESEAQIAANKGKFYFGVEVLAQVNFQPYDGIGNNPDGVNAFLNLVLSTNRGKKLATATVSAAQAFSGYVGKQTDENPTDDEDVMTGSTTEMADDITV